MIVVPNLFGAYQRGREAAIEANFNDLRRYEDIEAARTQNDRAALQLLADQADFNVNRSLVRDQGDASALATDLLRTQHTGNILGARSGNKIAQAQYNAVANAEANGGLTQGFNNLAESWLSNTGTARNNALLNATYSDAEARALQEAASSGFLDSSLSSAVRGNLAQTRATGQANLANEDSTRRALIDNASATANQAAFGAAYWQGRASDLGSVSNLGSNQIRAQTLQQDNTINNLILERQKIDRAVQTDPIQAQAQAYSYLSQVSAAYEAALASGNAGLVQALASEVGVAAALVNKTGGTANARAIIAAANTAFTSGQPTTPTAPTSTNTGSTTTPAGSTSGTRPTTSSTPSRPTQGVTVATGVTIPNVRPVPVSQPIGSAASGIAAAQAGGSLIPPSDENLVNRFNTWYNENGIQYYNPLDWRYYTSLLNAADRLF